MQKQDEKEEEIIQNESDEKEVKIEETKSKETKQEVKHEAKHDKAKSEKDIKDKSLNKKIEKISNLSQEEFEKKQSKQKNKVKKCAIIFSILFITLLLCSTIFALINMNSDKIISGITINGIEMSGLSKDEAKEKIRKITDENKNKEISLKYKEFETSINPEQIEVNYNIESVVEDAYNIGRNSNIFANNYSILFTMIGKKNIDVEVSFNEEELKKAIQDASTKLPEAIKESSYYIEDDNLIITKGKKGFIIDTEDTIKQIKDNLNNINQNNQDFIELKVIEKEPDAIDLDAIYKEVYKEAKNAYYTKEPFQIYPEVNGVDFNLEEAKEQLKEDKEEYSIKLNITVPEITVDQIGTEAFPDRLAIFTTRYDASNYNRTTNLRIACEKIDGKVLLPDEVFSYNQTLGERTIGAGYKEAKVYENGRVVDGLGGGICQISSTLYNAVVMADLEVVERRNHQFVTSYLPAGRDATVVYGLTDFKFKNTRQYPIKLQANVQNGIATIAIYGIKEDKEYVIDFDTRTIASLPFSTQYVDDPSLAPGEEVVEQGGNNGIQTETYITKTSDGVVVSRELLSKDTYTPMQRIVRRGGGEGEAAPQEPATPEAQPEEQTPEQPAPEPVAEQVEVPQEATNE